MADVPYQGHRVGDPLRDVAAMLGDVVGNLEVEAFRNPSSPVLAALHDVMAAVRKLEAGEPLSLRELEPMGVPDVSDDRLLESLATNYPPRPVVRP